MSNVSSVNPNNITKLIEQINTQKADIENKISKSKADFGDDGLFNATAEGSTIGSTDLTMEKVNSMSFDEILQLMATPSDADINTSLEAEEANLNQYLEQFEALQTEITQLQDEISALEEEVENLTKEREEAENKLARYTTSKEKAEEEVAQADTAYKRAISNKQSALDAAEQKAYDDAVEEFAKQSAAVQTSSRSENEDNEEENNSESNNSSNNISFAEILSEKRRAAGCSNSYDSAIAEAASELASKKANVKKYEKLMAVQQGIMEEKTTAIAAKNNVITNKNTQLSQKQTALTTVSTNIQVCQSNVNQLQQQMAVRNFINQNMEAILDVAYEKDPAAIASRQAISDAEATVTGQLTIAQNAEAAAAQAAKDGDTTKAAEEKEKAEAAKQAAEAAKQRAEAEEAKLKETYGETRTAAQTAKVQGISTNVQAIQAAAANAANAVTNATAVRTNQNAITTSLATVSAQIDIANAAQAAAQEAINNGDTATAEAEKAKVQAALEEAKKAQAAAQAAEAELQRLGATDQKAAAMASINQSVSGMTSLVTNIDNAIQQVRTNAEAAAAREAAGVTFATEVVNGESVTDVNRVDLTSMISAAELALVTANGINLAEPIEVTVNGKKCYYPRYIIAKAKDGRYHIYERSVDSKGRPNNRLASLARTYGKNNGYNIIANGSGYMTGTQEVEQGATGAKEVYYITCASSDLKSCQFGTTYKAYGTCSPLSLDLNGDGVKTSQNVIDYDIDGDGVMDRINDSADAVLVFDKDGDGVSGSNGSECFGNNTDLDGDGIADGYKDGFEALKALALREGLINNDDDMQLDENDIKHLEENFGFKIKAGGYNDNAQSLSTFGITCINLARTNETTMQDNFDGLGNQLMSQEGATFVQNGETKDYGDIWHKKLEEEKPAFLGLTLAA